MDWGQATSVISHESVLSPLRKTASFWTPPQSQVPVGHSTSAQGPGRVTAAQPQGFSKPSFLQPTHSKSQGEVPVGLSFIPTNVPLLALPKTPGGSLSVGSKQTQSSVNNTPHLILKQSAIQQMFFNILDFELIGALRTGQCT